jgi:hypothetical protein
MNEAVASADVAAGLCDDSTVDNLGMWFKQLPEHGTVVRHWEVANIQLAVVRQHGLPVAT